MKYKTILCGLALALAGTALAQNNDTNWGDKISELRTQHAELKLQVEAGTLTKEEAREQWQDIMAAAQAEKDAYFEARTERLETRIAVVAENNPERAAQLEARLQAQAEARATAKAEREAIRASIQAERQALRAQVQAGEITTEEARARAEANRTENEQKRQEAQTERKESFEAARTDRQENRAERQENRPQRAENQRSQPQRVQIEANAEVNVR